MKTNLLYYILLSMLCASCYKPKTNKGDSLAKLTLFSTCGVPCKNCYVEISGVMYGGNKKTTYILGNGYTNDSGYCEINHGNVRGGEIDIKVDDRTIIQDGRLESYYRDTTYSIIAVIKANGAKLPVELPDYLTYTSADTLFYRLLKGQTADKVLRYKTGPFQNAFIDTLSFPNISYAKILEAKGMMVDPYESANLLIWGKGKVAYDTANDTNKGIWFNDMGCDFLMSAKLE